MLNLTGRNEIIFHFNKKHLEDANIPMWVIKTKGESYYVNHVEVLAGVGFNTKETPDNPHTFNNSCIFIYKGIMSKRKTILEFIEESIKTHGNKYQYDKVIYKNGETNVIITCPIHGDFNQTPYTHISGFGCRQCSNEKLSKKYSLTNDTFISKGSQKHHHKYDYSLVNYKNSKTKIDIICNEHGKFNQLPESHLLGRGCPVCRESKGEKEIRSWLNTNGINYISQHKFDDCLNVKTKRKLPFDFYLKDENLVIEYQGKQHFSTKFGGFGADEKRTEINFQNLKNNDLIKKQYCILNQINFLEITYIDNIIEKLKGAIQLKGSIKIETTEEHGIVATIY